MLNPVVILLAVLILLALSGYIYLLLGQLDAPSGRHRPDILRPAPALERSGAWEVEEFDTDPAVVDFLDPNVPLSYAERFLDSLIPADETRELETVA